MKQCLRQDFLYYIRKMYLPFFVLLNVVLCVSTLYNGHMTANSDLDDYISAKSNYEKGIASSFAYPDGDVIEVESEDGIEILKNKAEHSVAAICPQYSIEYSMISILMLSLIVMSIFGISYELLDGKNNIMRIKVARFKRRDIFVAKQMMLLFFTLITMIVSILLSYIVNKVLFLKLLRKYPIVKEFDFNMYLYKNDWIKKIVVFVKN